jgi:hypothetical protein
VTQLIAWVSPRRAFVAVNTLYYAGAGAGEEETTKLYPLPLSSMLLAGRGSAALILRTFVHLQMQTARSVDLDACEQELPDTLPALCAELRSRIPADAEPEVHAVQSGRQEILLVGWSKRQARMRGVFFQTHDGRTRFTVSELNPCIVAPANDLPSGLAEPNSIEAIERIAAAQCRAARANSWPRGVAGGRLLVAEITRDRITTTLHTM